MSDSPGFLRATIQRAGSLVLAPVRRLTPAFLLGTSHSTESTSQATTHTTGSSSSPPAQTSSSGSMRLPAPVSFLGSPYLFTTLALAFLLHRIRHLVPPRQAFTTHARNYSPDLRRAMMRVFSPWVQCGIRLPSILVMLRVAAALALAVALANGADLAWLVPVVADAPRGPTPAGHACRAVLRLLAWSTAWAGGQGALGAVLGAHSPDELARALSHDALLWSAYLAAAFGLTCETFVRALADDTGVSQPLNLLSFSFLLHVYSDAARTATLGFGTSSGGAGGSAGGGNGNGAAGDVDEVPIGLASTQLYIYLVTILVELATLQLSYCAHWLQTPAPGTRRTNSPRRYRLPITAVFSLVQQAFAIRSLGVLWGWVDGSNPERRMLEADQFGTVWLNKVPEVCFELIVGSSVAVKALAAAIRGEELSFENLVGHPVMSPTSEEDYPVALIKYVTHLLSSTRLSGLALELHPLDVLPLALSTQLEHLGLVEPPPCGDPRCELHGAAVRAQQARERADDAWGVTLGRGGDVLFDEPLAVAGFSSAVALAPPGLGREFRRINVAAHDGAVGDDAGGEFVGPSGRRTAGLSNLTGERKSALWRLVSLVLRVALYVTWRVLRAVRTALRWVAAIGGWRRDEWALERGWTAAEVEERRRREDTPFPDGMDEREEDDDEDSDDEEWQPRLRQGARRGDDAGSSESGSEVDDDGAESSDEEDAPAMRRTRSASARPPVVPVPLAEADSDPDDDRAPFALFADTEGQDAESLAPYVLAHQLARPSCGPLTRRRYRALLPSSSSSPSPSSSSTLVPRDPESALASAIAARRADVLAALPGRGRVESELERARDKWREERARFCVVCTVEERCIVLWPCRCLCLCEDCRASLADRTTNTGAESGSNAAGGGGGLCPTCRSEVQGFSRIWVP